MLHGLVGAKVDPGPGSPLASPTPARSREARSTDDPGPVTGRPPEATWDHGHVPPEADSPQDG
jgi:hypothetical protein